MKKNLLKPVERAKEESALITITGKPLSQFYKLPFEKGSRVLRLEVLELHSTFRVGKKTNLVERKLLSFKQGLLTVTIKLKNEAPERVYIWVEYDHLLVSCSVDTDETYLGRYAYHILRAMLWTGSLDFNKYYWPECFGVNTERSKYVDIIKKPNGPEIRLKKKFIGLFRPGDYFPEVKERVLEQRPTGAKHAVANLVPMGVGYCFANTDLQNFHSNHYPFLIPYVYAATAYLKTVKSYKSFVFNAQDVEGISVSPQQQELNSICFAMKKIASIRFSALPETVAEINRINEANHLEIFKLWNNALPLLVQQPFTHYLYTYGMRNVAGKPVRRDMKLAFFSMDIPVLSFLLRDKGDYYELQLRLKVKGKLLKLSSDSFGLFLVCDCVKTYLWYLLGAEMDYRLVWFFSKVNFRVQVPKGYYKAHFERYVEGIERWYVVKRV
ncbi:MULTISPECIES: hypothetical protein [unclassified Pedobacter]|uniref:hypothetical protein n=1 Tax=unclassified Pedobacter TaxID=2628915 RepID=UPI001DE9CCA5|nr:MULTISPECIES: hypothetical protein [unclassified Pedobacter]CAH0137428.1 hypothetical protein SRABI126_00202 [Pedobacter sp. Bi126]CAH0220977.1 hypothetical protein SRABI36_02479 [Pedobacter sp. Bi36]